MDSKQGKARTFDLVIRGGDVIDGTGTQSVRADVGITGDRIVEVGDLSHAAGGRVWNANGLRVVPGFIDIHTHSDISVTYDPGQASYIAMGVTTQVVGNCALSMGLATDSDAFLFEKRWLAPHGVGIVWNSFAEHLRLIEDGGVATNFIPLAGHGTLRKRVIGLDDRAPDAGEMTAMQRELAIAMEAGAWGFSSGLEYPPSAFADEDELIDLCKVVAAHGGFYATHMRNEGDYLVEAVQEALTVAERAGLPLQISHHKAEGRQNWGKVRTTLGMIDAARARGVDVQLDQYPYTAFMTALHVQVLPPHARGGSPEEVTARLTDPVSRAAVLAEIRAAHPEWEDLSESSPWSLIQIGVCRKYPEIQGRTILELAKASGTHPIEYVVDLIADTDGFVSAVNFAIDEEDIAEVMRHPWTSIGSDGVGTHPGGTASEDKIHPRAYGSFPRVLGRYVREMGILTEAQAIHKMTGLPAARLGLRDRGLIRPGWFADVTLYDPRTIHDNATFDDPHLFSTGIQAVLVNGRIAFEHGLPNGALAGRVLARL